MFTDFFLFCRQFGALEVFFPGAQARAWNCMAPLSSCWLFFICSFLPACMATPVVMWRPSRHVDFSLKSFHSNSICHMCSAPARGGVMGRHIYFFSHFQDDITSSFSYKAALLRCGGIQETRKKNHNPRIKEHDIFYLDTKNEISLTMFIDFFSFRSQFGPLKFFSLEPKLALETPWRPSRHDDFFLHFFFLACMHGDPLVMWRPSCHVDFSLTFLHSNSISHMCSAPALALGVMGAPYLLLFPFPRRYHELFSHKAALLRCGGIQETRKKS